MGAARFVGYNDVVYDLREHIEETHTEHADAKNDEGNHDDEKSLVFAATVKKFVKHGKPPCGCDSPFYYHTMFSIILAIHR